MYRFKKGVKQTDELIRKRAIANTGKKRSEETKKKISLGNKGKTISEETKEKLSESIKKIWTNPEYRAKTIEAQLKGLFKRPTSLENKFIRIIRKHKLPYKYVGDGSFLIGYKNPDFVDINGEKRCIEIRPRCMVGIWSKGLDSPESYEHKRKEHFAKYGWKCQVIWHEDFKISK